MLFERALRELPGSYKLWRLYLTERRQQVRGKRLSDPAFEAVNNVFDRALVFMHKMPRIWLDYLQFLVAQKLVTRTRHAFDRALRALPVTQHERIWDLYIKFVKQPFVPSETAVRVATLYSGMSCCCSLAPSTHCSDVRCVQLDPSSAEEFVEYLTKADRLDEAAGELAHIVNDETFVAPSGKTRHQVRAACSLPIVVVFCPSYFLSCDCNLCANFVLCVCSYGCSCAN